MKKIFILLALSSMVVSSSFASDLSGILTATSLSNGVSGSYLANNTAAGDDATDFIISTGHSQGTLAYATGNFVSEIYSKTNAAAGEKFASSDLMTTETYTSAAMDTWAD